MSDSLRFKRAVVFLHVVLSIRSHVACVVNRRKTKVNGNSTEYTEHIFMMKADLCTLDPRGKGSEVFTSAATEVKDMDDDEVTNLAAIYWNSTQHCVGIMLDHHDHKRSWHTCSSSTASIPRIWPQSVARAEQMVPTKTSCRGTHHRERS